MSNANKKEGPPYTILRTENTPKGGKRVHVRLRGGRQLMVAVPQDSNNPDAVAAAIDAAAASNATGIERKV